MLYDDVLQYVKQVALRKCHKESVIDHMNQVFALTVWVITFQLLLFHQGCN